MRKSIKFLRSGQIVELSGFRPTMTVLEYLRLWENSKGMKEGCCEGDCGACTVVVGRKTGDKLTYEPVNACILFLGMLDGTELVTVEDLGTKDNLHPVQSAMVQHHGSQCGFCTPGFVMSLFALYHAGFEEFDRNLVNDWFSGNLCRCTGYRSIVDSARFSCFDGIKDHFSARSSSTLELLKNMDCDNGFKIGDDESYFYAPQDLDSMTDFYQSNPDATIVSGATDVGLWVTKQLQHLPKIIWLGKLPELQECRSLDGELKIGATATYANSASFITQLDPDLEILWRQIGSRQIRASGTIGGNIANGSPVGDTIPALISLGAKIEIRQGGEVRTIALEDFYQEYGKQDLRPGEVLTHISIPKKVENQKFRCFKVSKRFDQDISAVMGAFNLTLENSRIVDVRIAYGGMSAIPKRANLTENALNGADHSDPATWSLAIKSIDEDFSPISDVRAGSNYRIETARALLVKALMEVSGMSQKATRLSKFQSWMN